MTATTRTLFLATALLLVSLPSTMAWAKLPSEQTIAAFTQARELLDSDPERAWTLANSIDSLAPADEVRLDLLAETALRTQRMKEALDFLVQFERTTDDDGEKYRARLEQAEVLAWMGELDRAYALLEGLRKDRSDARGRGADRRYLFSRLERLAHDIALAQGNTKRARDLAENLLVHYPTELATQREGLATAPENLSDAQRYRRAHNLSNSWGYHDARAEFERLKDHKEYGKNARWELGIIGLRKLRDRPEEAEQIFRQLIKEEFRAEDAHWYLARALMRLEKYDEALKVFDQIQKQFPRGKHVEAAYYYRGWLPYDHRDNKAAIEGLRAYVDKYKRRHRNSSYIYGFLAWAHMREKQWEEAIKVWDDMQPFGNTLVAGKALYWKAYALNELGRQDEAKKTIDELRRRYSLTYYSMLGEQLRAKIDGADARASQVWWPEGGGVIDDEPRIDVLTVKFRKLSKKDARAWERTKVLALLGEKHLARAELSPIVKKLNAEIPDKEQEAWIHALGWFVGDYNMMYQHATGSRGIRAMPNVPPGDELRSAMAYPRAYRDIVEEVGEEFDIPGYFIWAIMRQESRYKPGAVSFTDAVGALQMIPKTARHVARDLGLVFDVRTFFRPEVGFRYSGYYMHTLSDAFDGLFVPTATAYNSGPVVLRWFRRNPEAEFAWLIEEFEYNEGRAYGRKVMEHMLRYLYLYEPDAERRGAILERMFPLSRDIDLPDAIAY